MNLSGDDHTPFDLNWTMFGVPVRVHPFFWLMSVLLGWSVLDEGLIYLFLWVACVFVSVLLHELGHVFMGRVFGTHGHILLWSFGGLAISSSDLRKRWQRIAVYLAGPGIQFVLYGLLYVSFWWGLEPYLDPDKDYPHLFAAIGFLLLINWAWPLLNLLPIYPLDGGQISRDLFDWFRPRDGIRLSLMVSLGLSGLLAANYFISVAMKEPFIPFLGRGTMFRAVFFLVFAVNNYQLLQQTTRTRTWYRTDDRAPWETDPDEWKRR